MLILLLTELYKIQLFCFSLCQRMNYTFLQLSPSRTGATSTAHSCLLAMLLSGSILRVVLLYQPSYTTDAIYSVPLVYMGTLNFHICLWFGAAQWLVAISFYTVLSGKSIPQICRSIVRNCPWPLSNFYKRKF